MLDQNISVSEIANWLREDDPNRLSTLFTVADETRKTRVGEAVWLRGLLEISSNCRRNCFYCGMRASRKMERYRMTRSEILSSAEQAFRFSYGTLVIQSGEDLSLSATFISELILEIRERYGLTITLSLGERSESELALWKTSGAQRYLLRFETSNATLYRRIHPLASDSLFPDRIGYLRILRELGYEVGSGVLIGIPGQSYDDLARDLSLFRELDLDMIGCGPFLPHPSTPLGTLEIQAGFWRTPASSSPRDFFSYPTTPFQVPNTNLLAYKVVALSRILCPDANIPSTTAVATLDGRDGRKGALERGANVIMPNVTPEKYRSLYEIYPNKSGAREDAATTRATALRQIAEIGRFPGRGSGSSPRFLARSNAE